MPTDRIQRIRHDPQWASRSLTCAVSINFTPPRLINGSPLRESSISRSNEWKLDRNSTAISLERHPFFAKLKNLLRDESRLRILPGRLHQRRQRPIESSS